MEERHSRLLILVILTCVLCYLIKTEMSTKKKKMVKHYSSVHVAMQVVCTVLHEHDANVHEKKKDRAALLFHKAQNSNADVCTVLFQHNGNVNEKGKNGATALFSAVQNGHANVCTALLERNKNVNQKLRRWLNIIIPSCSRE